jgi:hypothetical protein
MILYIEETVKLATTNYPSITDEDLEYQFEEIEHMRKVLDGFGVSYGLHAYMSGPELHLYEQKISLGEIDMNTLISLIMNVFETQFVFKYGNYGGAGCDFSLRLERT